PPFSVGRQAESLPKNTKAMLSRARFGVAADANPHADTASNPPSDLGVLPPLCYNPRPNLARATASNASGRNRRTDNPVRPTRWLYDGQIVRPTNTMRNFKRALKIALNHRVNVAACVASSAVI